jgi:hypothetical protein
MVITKPLCRKDYNFGIKISIAKKNWFFALFDLNICHAQSTLKILLDLNMRRMVKTIQFKSKSLFVHCSWFFCPHLEDWKNELKEN